MKKSILPVFVFCFSFLVSHSQNPGEWMWINGDSVGGSFGNFGTQGIPSSTNEPPALYEPCEWTDLNGNFWLYGGVDAGGNSSNDLWKYDPVSNEWTWMKGTNTPNDLGNYGAQSVSTLANRPPAKGHGPASWVDNNGDLWMFGGYNPQPGGCYSDLWRYNIATNQWTWMKGPNSIAQIGTYGTQGSSNPANNPGCRGDVATTWTDSAGKLWLFGGTDYASYFNDLWCYNIATNEWTWMKGSNLSSVVGVYGTKGVEAPANTPGARWAYSKWKDNSGNFWLFGGCYDNNGGLFNGDLWRYNPSTNNWAWFNGSSLYNTSGIYGSKCVADSNNTPGARMENRCAWVDANGDFWMFGGGWGGGSLYPSWNDLWKYCVATNQWIWVNGDSSANALGSWGTLNISSPANKPDARAGAIGWTDKKGHLYVFGGSKVMYQPFHNDIWKFSIDSSCAPCLQSLPNTSFNSSDTSFCGEPGKCISFYDHSTGNPTGWQWLFPGAAPDTSSQQNPTNICYYNVGTYPVTLIVANASGSDTLTVSPMITVGGTPPAPTITKVGDTLYSSHASGYQWYFNGNPISGATDSFYVATQPGTYSVGITDSNGCSSLSNGVLASVSELNYDAGVTVYPNPASQSAVISWQSAVRGNIDITIVNVLGEKVYGTQLRTANYGLRTDIDVTSLSDGVYFLRIDIGERTINKKFVVMHN